MQKIKKSLLRVGCDITRLFGALTFLWFAHCLGDYALQTKSVALFKGKSLLICFIHASIWTGIMLIGFGIVARLGLLLGASCGLKFEQLKWYAFLVIGYILLGSHLVIDYGKIYTCFFSALPEDLSHFNPFTQRLLFVDQVLHLGSILLCYFLLGLMQHLNAKKEHV